MANENHSGAYRFMILLVMMIPSIVCCALAGRIIQVKGPETEGWGWLLIIGFLLALKPLETARTILIDQIK